MTKTTEQALKQQQADAEREHSEHQTAIDWESEGPPPEEQQDEADFASAQSRELATTTAPPTAGDGWEEEAHSSDRTVRGNLLKYADRVWAFGRDARPMRKGAQLLAVGVATAWQRWEGKKRVEARIRKPGAPFPTRDALGHTDENQWERRPDGKPRDCWQLTKFVYLIDSTSGELFTFVTTSGGGQSAIADLADTILFMRGARPGAVPLVELSDADMPTRFGMKSRPVFRVVGWRGGEELTKLTPPSAGEIVDDEIAF